MYSSSRCSVWLMLSVPWRLVSLNATIFFFSRWVCLWIHLSWQCLFKFRWMVKKWVWRYLFLWVVNSSCYNVRNMVMVMVGSILVNWMTRTDLWRFPLGPGKLALCIDSKERMVRPVRSPSGCSPQPMPLPPAGRHIDPINLHPYGMDSCPASCSSISRVLNPI